MVDVGDSEYCDYTVPAVKSKEEELKNNQSEGLLEHLRQLGKDVRSGACRTYTPLNPEYKLRRV